MKHRKHADGRATDPDLLTEAAACFSARGKYAAAEKRLLQTAKSLCRKGSSSRRERAVVWNALGIICKYLGKFRSAGRYYHQALRSVSHLTRCDSLIADLYHNLGGLEHSRGRFTLALKYARKGLALRLQSELRDSPSVASDLIALAAILVGLKKYDESEKLYYRALRVYRSQFGAFQAEIAVVLNNLGALHQAAGRYQRAGLFYRAALSSKRRVLGDSHPDLVLTMNNLGTLYYAQDRVSNASFWIGRALCLARVALGRSHPVTRTLESNHCRISSPRNHSLVR